LINKVLKYFSKTNFDQQNLMYFTISNMYFFENIAYRLEKTPSNASDFYRIMGMSEQQYWARRPQPDFAQLLAIRDLFGLSLDMLVYHPMRAREEAANRDIRMLVVDIDGVMTDGGMYYTESGDEFKKFDTKDGLAIKRVTKKGFPMGIISSGFNVGLIRKRAEILGIQRVHAGVEPKLGILEKWCAEMGITLAQVAYIGDDLNDQAVIQSVGFSACPVDATEAIKQLVHVVLTKKGGKSCVREFIEGYLVGIWGE
jgi:3-deoxy-D-manno-octulosonate 8-phosphate phosphatase (KDO 8-P phosphatase)